MNLFELPILETTPTELEFAASATGAVVTGCSPNVTQVVVPSHYAGVRVTGVGSDAFRSHPHLLSVTLPDTVETIGEGAFMDCRSLMTVRGGRGLKQVQACAFFNCVNLQHVDFPTQPQAALTAFAGCYQLEAAGEPVTYR